MKLEITKEKVLEAASKCETAKQTLEALFPECFENSFLDQFDDYHKLLAYKIPKDYIPSVTKSGDIIIPLPNANSYWSDLCFKLAIAIQEKGYYYYGEKSSSERLFLREN